VNLLPLVLQPSVLTLNLVLFVLISLVPDKVPLTLKLKLNRASVGLKEYKTFRDTHSPLLLTITTITITDQLLRQHHTHLLHTLFTTPIDTRPTTTSTDFEQLTK
jgi:hypothetical protein